MGAAPGCQHRSAGDGRTKFFGSYSRYFIPVAVNTNVRLAGGELDYDAYYQFAGLMADNTPILGAPITTGAGFTACPNNSPAGTACTLRNDGTVRARPRWWHPT